MTIIRHENRQFTHVKIIHIQSTKLEAILVRCRSMIAQNHHQGILYASKVSINNNCNVKSGAKIRQPTVTLTTNFKSSNSQISTKNASVTSVLVGIIVNNCCYTFGMPSCVEKRIQNIVQRIHLDFGRPRHILLLCVR
jgi:hypothetical protein